MNRPLGVQVLFDQLGNNSGYGGYFRFLPELNKLRPVLLTRSRVRFLERIGGKTLQIASRKKGKRNQSNAFLEWKFGRSLNRNQRAIHHLLSADLHFDLLQQHRRANNLTGTIHFPFDKATEQEIEKLKSMRGALCLSSRDAILYAQKLPSTQVDFVHHPVDLEFFSPSKVLGRSRTLICVGGFCRDFAFFATVARELLLARVVENVRIVGPSSIARLPEMELLRNLPSVEFLWGIDDQVLLEIYRNAGAAFIPFTFASANNAVVECLATGTPLVSTLGGGLASYGGGDFIPLIKSGDVATACQELTRVLDSSDTERTNHSRKMREFAIANLSYSHVAEKHHQFFSSISP